MATLKTKQLRRVKRISLKRLSKECGVSRSYISEIESGKHNNPGVLIVCKLCKALNTTPNELITEELWKGEENE